MTDKEHADKIIEKLMDLMTAVNDATKDGLTVSLEPVRLGPNFTSFSADVKRVTPIAKFP